MFNKTELQVVIKTLTHRRDWLVKNLNNAELDANKVQNQDTLTVIESALSKLALYENKNLSDIPSIKITSTDINAKREQLAPEKIRVLVADDDGLSASLITTYLQAVGLKKIHVAADGQKAISMLFEANPVFDLVLCDWNMPLKSGLDVYNAMRSAERYQDTCFMLVTAVTGAKQIRAAIEEGVDDYLAKPIDQSALNKKLARIFPKIKLSE